MSDRNGSHPPDEVPPIQAPACITMLGVDRDTAISVGHEDRCVHVSITADQGVIYLDRPATEDLIHALAEALGVSA
jgi:hypothetical protein